MVGTLIAVETVIGVLLLCALLFVVITMIRRRTLASGSDLVHCGMQSQGEGRWRWGLLRLSPTHLEWFPIFGMTLRPGRRWIRGSLELSGMHSLSDSEEEREAAEMVDDRAVRVDFTANLDSGVPCQGSLALGRENYMALRSWVESAPPGDLPVEG